MKAAMLRIRWFDVCAVLAVSTFWAVGSNAQEYRGRVQGVVTDATDAAVSGASVRLQNVDTGVTTIKPTDNYGHYLFDLVAPGAYTLEVGKSKQIPVTVIEGQTTTVSID